MASGILGSANLVAATSTLLFTAAAVQTCNIRFCNRTGSIVHYTLAIGVGSTPTWTDYLNFALPVAANGVVEDTGLVLSAGEKVWVMSDTAGVSVRAHGL